MKIQEQKKAVRSGYDMDILPSDLATYGTDAKQLLSKLQTRNERLFMVTFLVLNMADTQRKLSNEVFRAAGVAQKYNCALVRLDDQQEQGLMSSLRFGNSRVFGISGKYGAVSFLQILAPELSDEMLADFLNTENGIVVNLHVQAIEQTEAIKRVKRKITDLDAMKIQEQKKAVRSGYDMLRPDRVK